MQDLGETLITNDIDQDRAEALRLLALIPDADLAVVMVQMRAIVPPEACDGGFPLSRQ